MESFMYVYFSDSSLRQLRLLVLSVITVRCFYLDSSIVVIDYSSDDRLEHFSKMFDFKIIKKAPCYVNNKNIGVNMVSKPMDCMNVGRQLGLNDVVVLDSDVFLLNRFKDLDFSKFSMLFQQGGLKNSGILSFSINSEAIQLFSDIYGFLVGSCNADVEFVKYCHSVLGRKVVPYINEEDLITVILCEFNHFRETYHNNLINGNHGYISFFVHTNMNLNNIHFAKRIRKFNMVEDRYIYPLMLKEYSFVLDVVDSRFLKEFFGVEDLFKLSFMQLKRKMNFFAILEIANL